jgi:PhnB protein
MKAASTLPKLTPLLVVRDAARAIDFYVQALGATEVARYTNRVEATVSHADLTIGDAMFSVTEEAHAWNSDAPPSLGGSPVVLQLQIEDVEAAFECMLKAGATVVFPLVEFCGERMGRVRDPFRSPLDCVAADRGAVARGEPATQRRVGASWPAAEDRMTVDEWLHQGQGPRLLRERAAPIIDCPCACSSTATCSRTWPSSRVTSRTAWGSCRAR